MDKKKQKASVHIDPQDNDPKFEEKLLEAQRKEIERSNPGLHAVFEKYKNHHKKDKV